MSRVFEALNRAQREREACTGQPNNEWARETEGFPEETIDSAGRFAPTQNGVAHVAPNTSVPKALPVRVSWRERIEELFFGWGLYRYSANPIFALQNNSPAAEQYKILREQLRTLRAAVGVQTIAITSPIKKDGKTTVAVNLAAAMALDHEEKVLLIDADLRAPSIHRYFNSDNTTGLAEYLSSNWPREVKGLVRETQVGGLSILPAGKPSQSAPELLGKERMSELLGRVRTELPGHFVIMDLPPVLATPDPLVMARHVDGIIMVVRAGRTPRDYLTKALNALSSGRILGVVLNGAELGLDSKYYYYSSNS